MIGQVSQTKASQDVSTCWQSCCSQLVHESLLYLVTSQMRIRPSHARSQTRPINVTPPDATIPIASTQTQQAADLAGSRQLPATAAHFHQQTACNRGWCRYRQLNPGEPEPRAPLHCTAPLHLHCTVALPAPPTSCSQQHASSTHTLHPSPPLHQLSTVTQEMTVNMGRQVGASAPQRSKSSQHNT